MPSSLCAVERAVTKAVLFPTLRLQRQAKFKLPPSDARSIRGVLMAGFMVLLDKTLCMPERLKDKQTAVLTKMCFVKT